MYCTVFDNKDCHLSQSEDKYNFYYFPALEQGSKNYLEVGLSLLEPLH